MRLLARREGLSWSAAKTEVGAPCLLLSARSRSALERVCEAHLAIPLAELPAPIAWSFGPGESWLALDCEPVGTLDDLRELVPKRSIPYAEALVVTRTLARVLAAAHAAPGGPFLLGALSPSQVVVDRAGKLGIVGLGFGEAEWDAAAYRSPSVAMGHPPSRASDVHTGLLFVRAHIQWINEVPPGLARLLRGEPGPLERAFGRGLVDALMQSSQLDGHGALRALERFWAAMGVVPDEEGFGRRALDALARASLRIDVARDHSWFSVEGGPRLELLRREPVRRVLRALVEANGAAMSVDEIARSAWPGEVLVGSSGPDRVYVAISSLRKLGLRDALVRDDRGYTLRVRPRFVAPEEPG